MTTQTETATARTAYLSLFNTRDDAIEFENQVLNIGRSLLPECARAVLDNKDDGPDYYAWLIEQAQQASITPHTATIRGGAELIGDAMDDLHGAASDCRTTCYVLRCSLTGESQEVTCCQAHARKMPAVDGDRVTTYPSEGDCEFCPEVVG